MSRLTSKVGSVIWIVLVDDAPYPCFVNEGVVAGICRAFASQRGRYDILDPLKAKRMGGRTTRYSVSFERP